MRNSGRRSREGTRSNSKGNATDGDDDDDDEEEQAENQVCPLEGTSSSAISVVEAIVKQKVLDEVLTHLKIVRMSFGSITYLFLLCSSLLAYC